jgi:hypothetical protein
MDKVRKPSNSLCNFLPSIIIIIQWQCERLRWQRHLILLIWWCTSGRTPILYPLFDLFLRWNCSILNRIVHAVLPRFSMTTEVKWMLRWVIETDHIWQWIKDIKINIVIKRFVTLRELGPQLLHNIKIDNNVSKSGVWKLLFYMASVM